MSYDWKQHKVIVDLKSDMGALENEFKKINQFWVDKYNELWIGLKVAIGVRNNKIAEQSRRITILEKQLKKLTEQVDMTDQIVGSLQ